MFEKSGCSNDLNPQPQEINGGLHNDLDFESGSDMNEYVDCPESDHEQTIAKQPDNEQTIVKSTEKTEDNVTPHNMNNNKESEPQINTNNAECILCSNMINEFMLQCNTCKGWVHYEYTGLPSYKLAKYIYGTKPKSIHVNPVQ